MRESGVRATHRASEERLQRVERGGGGGGTGRVSSVEPAERCRDRRVGLRTTRRDHRRLHTRAAAHRPQPCQQAVPTLVLSAWFGHPG
jgi:hypothetical protein